MSASRSGRTSVLRWTAGWIACVVIVAVSGVGHTYPALALTQAGHWLWSNSLGAVLHVDGASKSVDAKSQLGSPLDPSAQVSVGQDSRYGYAVYPSGQLKKFSKSTLRVTQTLRTPAGETPVVLDGVGGPYLVYQKLGRIVRMSDDRILAAGGDRVFTDPVLTGDGTLWVQRSGDTAASSGSLCKFPAGSTSMSCSVRVPAGQQTSLVTLGDRPAVVDTETGSIAPITSRGLGHATGGAPRGSNVEVSDSDAGGRLPMLVQDEAGKHSRLVLVDTSRVGAKRVGNKPVSVDVGPGEYARPLVAGPTVVLVDRATNTIWTYSNGGTKLHKLVAADSGPLKPYRGDDGRVYIDNHDGTRTYVIDGDGTVTPVDMSQGGAGQGPAGPSKSTPQHKPSPTKPGKTASGQTSSSAQDAEPGGSSSSIPAPTSSASTPPPSGASSGSPRLPALPGLPSDAKPRHNPKASAPPTFPPTSSPGSGGGTGGNGDTNGDNGRGTKTRHDGNSPSRPPGQSAGRPRHTEPAAVAPDAPATVNATPGVGRATVRWTTPSSNGAKISGYHLSWHTVSGKDAGSRNIEPGQRHATITGLVSGTSYIVTVSARNRVGRGPATASDRFRIKYPPASPLWISATASSDGTVHIHWRGGVGGRATYTLIGSDGRTIVAHSKRTEATAKSLTAGQAYQFTVVSSDGSGKQASKTTDQVIAWNASDAPAEVDNAPPGNGEVELCWMTPKNLNGGKLVGYELRSSAGQTLRTSGDATDATIDVTPGARFQVSVRAITSDPNGSGKTTLGAPATVSGTADPAPPKAPMVIINSASLTADHALVIDIHLHDGGASSWCAVAVNGTQVYHDTPTRGGDSEIRVPNVKIPAGTTANVQVGCANEVGPGNTANVQVQGK